MNYALLFAVEKHKNQKRKFFHEPYIHHILRVAGYAQLYVTDVHDSLYLPVTYLHDVIEDCGVTYEYIESNFGKDVADGVLSLTNLYTKEKYPYLKRRERKFKEIDRLADCSLYIKQIKLCDRFDNLSSSYFADEKWKSRYAEETRYMLKMFGNISPLYDNIKILLKDFGKCNCQSKD